MAFWADRDFQPVRQFQYRISYIKAQGPDPQTAISSGLPEGQWWFAKSVTLPSFEINDTAYQLGNHKFKYPGHLTWNDVIITIIEKGDVANSILDTLSTAGYKCPGKPCGSGIQKGAFSDKHLLVIEQFDTNGAHLQGWNLRNWFIKSSNFGDASSDSAEFINVTLTVGYDCAEKYNPASSQ
tara:strand:+ start:523 stop:1068 length:546 start_codon:yes stop_codon:yes gene_type:complete